MLIRDHAVFGTLQRVQRSRRSGKTSGPPVVTEPLEARQMLSATVGLPRIVSSLPVEGWQTGLESVRPAVYSGLASTLQIASAKGAKAAAASGPYGFTPAQIRHAYGVDTTTFGNVTGDGTGQTIAIVDAYNDPTAWFDLQQFDQQFGLANPPSFSQINESGGTSLPVTDPAGKGSSWELEESLDIEWAHVIAPKANIVLVEANSPSFNDLLLNAARTAASLPGVTAVSMSFGGGEFSSEMTLDSVFAAPTGHNPVTFLASTGDNGAPAGYPALSPNVVAVGGTMLTVDAGSNYTSESGWSGSGGGISAYEGQPSYQSGVVASTHRAAPDVSFDASPSSGVAVYDSYDFGTATPWLAVGGTSLASPMWAGVVAIADQGRALNGLASLGSNTNTLPQLYGLPRTDFNDVTTGSNGYAAGPGYDLVTGLGTPKVNLVAPALAGSAPVLPTAPTVASAAKASTNPLTGTSVSLSVLGNDARGEATLSYTWSVAGAAGVSFSANGNNAAKNTIATFASVGTYTFSVVITNASGLSASSNVVVNVTPTLTRITVSPTTTSVLDGSSTQLATTASDQFGKPMSAGVVWSVDAGGLGTVNSSGLYTAPSSGAGSATVRATSGTISGTASVVYAAPTSTSGATFLGIDTNTQGNWKGVYGADGYAIADNAELDPTYAQVSGTGIYTGYWATSTSNVSALQEAGNTTQRIAAAWYNHSTFTINVNLKDGQSHRVSLYALDYDASRRNERIDILDSTGKVLSSQTISNFSSGEYLSWNIQGNVQIRVTNLGGSNAVISGLFFH